MPPKVQPPYAIHWFKKDLRIFGNSALQDVLRSFEGRVLGLYCIEPDEPEEIDKRLNQFAFCMATLQVLRKDLEAHGGDLLILGGNPGKELERLFYALKEAGNLPKVLSFNRDFDPSSWASEEKITQVSRSRHGIEVRAGRDRILIEPHELLRPGKQGEKGNPYKVFTPFARKWFQLFRRTALREQVEWQKAQRLQWSQKPSAKSFRIKWNQVLKRSNWNEVAAQERLDQAQDRLRKKITILLPGAGEKAARAEAQRFEEQIDSYIETRNIPSIKGTSQLSYYLQNGSISVAEIIAYFQLDRCRWGELSGRFAFLKELIWREFFYSVLYHRPEVVKEAFNPKYTDLRWENRKDYFEAWKEGRTGYPFVDAGMRQLKQTGWMHNRLRMVTGSFLVKDLLIDWRWGEKYFMSQLLDADVALNNGNWQWVASTGADPQPYFRIFNPVEQSKKFDSKGEFIKEYLPEARSQQGSKIHLPQNPIVHHASRRLKALQLYKK